MSRTGAKHRPTDRGKHDHSAFELLRACMPEKGQLLLIADENLLGAPFSSLPSSTLIISNRYDVYQQATGVGCDCRYSDFDFSELKPESIDGIFYRVSKEKAATHHVINQSISLLKPDGKITLAGSKNEGIKNYAKHAGALFSTSANIEKNGDWYRSTLTKPQTRNNTHTRLDDKDYASLREAVRDDNTSLYSKPGVFGWNKIDQGSAFLNEHLDEFFATFSQQPKDILDLGCGYGYLSAAVHRHIPEALITATDNNAAAIAACEKNFAELGISGSVVADNCGESLETRFDAVICNPPFHQGFDTSGDLTDRFLAASHRLLKVRGKALFVVNAFVPLEKKAKALYRNTTELASNRSFKLVMLEKTSRAGS
jgi:16S rRNA (guanine1207-N2)-methyltransferase